MESKKITHIYWEKQTKTPRSSILHCLNSILQGPFFTMDDINTDTDSEKDNHKTHLKIIESNLKKHNTSIFPIEQRDEIQFLLVDGVMIHNSLHWISFRKIQGKWYNFNSTNKFGPQMINDIYFEDFICLLKHSDLNLYTVDKLPDLKPINQNLQDFQQMVSTEDIIKNKKRNNSQGININGGKNAQGINLQIDFKSILVESETDFFCEMEESIPAEPDSEYTKDIYSITIKTPNGLMSHSRKFKGEDTVKDIQNFVVLRLKKNSDWNWFTEKKKVIWFDWNKKLSECGIEKTEMNIQHQQLGKTVLFISELPDNILDPDLETFFQDYKEYIVMIQVDRNTRIYDPYTQRSPKATIIFKDHEKAKEARDAWNMRRWKGKTLNIMWHEKDNSVRYNNTANIFVKGISQLAKPRDVYELFMTYGEIISSKWGDDENGNHLGYGYINYYHIESAERAIQDLNQKEKWGAVWEVGRFQKKNERQQLFWDNNSIYVKNFPSTYTEDDLKKMFKDCGAINLVKTFSDNNSKRKCAMVIFDSSKSAILAKERFNGKKIAPQEEEEWYVDLLQKKNDRKRWLNSKIGDMNSKWNQDTKNCNLHIKNIPHDWTEEKLHDIFSKYGEIKSVKIPKYILETKIKNEFKESIESKGFAYVCYTTPQGAQTAIEAWNYKYLEGYENQDRPPLWINIFMPKHERTQILSKIQGNAISRFPLVAPYQNIPFTAPNMGGYVPQPYNVHRHHGQNKPYNNRRQPQLPPQQIPQPLQQQQPQRANKEDEPDSDYLHSLDTIEAKKEYLGEYLFKKIEQHSLAHENSFTIDLIGRITGMILGIEDIKEIYEITMSFDSWTARINEAMTLLVESQQQNE